MRQTRHFIADEAQSLFRVLQYTDWEHLGDGYLNQKKIAEVVGDYFFICPTNLFAENFAARGTRVYYYYFTQVRLVTRRRLLPARISDNAAISFCKVKYVIVLFQFSQPLKSLED